MKTWNTPIIEELDVNMTANGFHNSDYEGRFLIWTYNDSKADKDDSEKTES